MKLNKKNLLKLVRHMWQYYRDYKREGLTKEATIIEFMREFIGEYESNVL